MIFILAAGGDICLELRLGAGRADYDAVAVGQLICENIGLRQVYRAYFAAYYINALGLFVVGGLIPAISSGACSLSEVMIAPIFSIPLSPSKVKLRRIFL